VNLIVAAEVEPANAGRPGQALVRRFLAWAQGADAEERADAASALARAYRYSNLPEDVRREAVVGLTAMLDDQSTLVRRALAEALASASDAPRHIVSALANDQPEIAAIMVGRSPLLSEAELVDCAAIGGANVEFALARRSGLTAPVAAALAEIAQREAVIALVENSEARLTMGALRRIVGRFGDDPEVREALLARPGLPAALRCELVGAAATALSPLAAAFGLGAERIQKLMREAREDGVVAVAATAERRELVDLVRHLRATGALTISLLTRALVCGDRAFFEATAAELSGLDPARVAAFVRAPQGSGFKALYRRTGLPVRYFAPCRAALAALHIFGADENGGVVRPIVRHMIAACEAERAPELDRLLPLLRRLEGEAAREEARAFVRAAAAERARDRAQEEAAREASDPNDAEPATLDAIEPDGVPLQPFPLLIAVNGLGDVEILPTLIDEASQGADAIARAA
jgi:uncharacterized protein (DUF2336 family)